MATAYIKKKELTLVPKGGTAGDILISEGSDSGIWKNMKEHISLNLPDEIIELQEKMRWKVLE